MSTRSIVVSIVALAAGWISPAGAEDETLFRATSDYVLELGEETVDGAEIFFSPRHVAYLVISDQLEQPLIVRLPEARAASVPSKAVEKDLGAGTARLAPGAPETPLGGIERRLDEIRFSLGEIAAALAPAPPIVGWRTPQTLRSRDLELRSAFARSHKSRLKSGELAIPAGQELLIEVFFGSWDGYSQQVLPGIMRLEEELAGSSASVRYYGLPRRIADDPVGVERSIHGVPTVIVSSGGTELGRLVGRALAEPGESLRDLLATQQSE